MLEPLVWLVVLEVIGLLALPIAFVAFRHLPDRGFFFAKPLGLLSLSYIAWLLAFTGFIPNSRGTLLVLVVLLGAAAAWWWARHWREYLGFARKEVWTLLLGEALFLTVFLGWTVIRAYTPDIVHTEQPMDFAFFNSVVRSPDFPPRDPWLAGSPISYYYFGYMTMGTVGALAGVPTNIGYNLALATVAALAAGGAFGLGYNLVRLAKGSADAGSLAGLVSVGLLLVVSNLEGVLEFMQAAHLGSNGFWQWVGIENLSAPAGAAQGWYPERLWWWFQASRVVPPGIITEFPFFSFILGDLHPHVMSIPFLLLFLGAALNLFASPVSAGVGWLWKRRVELLVLTLALGALPAINMWDLPTSAAVLAMVLVARAYGDSGGRLRAALRRMALVAVPVLLLALLLFIPFYATFQSQASWVLPVGGVATKPFHFVLIWGLFLFIGVTFIAVQVREVRRFAGWRSAAILALVVAFLPVVLWVLAELAAQWVVSGSALEKQLGLGLGTIVGRMALALPLGLLVASALYLALGRARREERWSDAGVFVLILMAVGWLLILGAELFYLVDVFNTRMNTVFKLYYQAWILLAVASGYAVYYLSDRLRPLGVVSRLASLGWWTVLVLLVLASLYYPAAAIHSRTRTSLGPTLDGLAYVARQRPGEYAVIQYLWARAPRDATIVEAVGNDYSEFSRISASTGLPTVVGWLGHEIQWRGSSRPFDRRPEDVEELYRTTDLSRARDILRKYNIDYIVVGPRERGKYGEQGVGKFAQLGRPVVAYPEIQLYEVTE